MTENNIEKGEKEEKDLEKEFLRKGLISLNANIYKKISKGLSDVAKEIRTVREEFKSSELKNMTKEIKNVKEEFKSFYSENSPSEKKESE